MTDWSTKVSAAESVFVKKNDSLKGAIITIITYKESSSGQSLF